MTTMNPRSSLNAAVPFAKRTDAVDFAGSDPLLGKLRLVGDWSIEWVGGHRGPFRLEISAPQIIEVRDERAERLPDFRTSRDGWLKGLQLAGVKAEECTISGAFLHESLIVKSTPGVGERIYVRGEDYDFDPDWGTLWRLEGGAISGEQEVWIDSSYVPQRIDSLVWDASGSVLLKEGQPHISMPGVPELREGETRLANIHLPGPISRLGEDNLFPVLESAFPEEPRQGRPFADELLPRTLAKLRSGEPLRILAWGDSVTGYKRYQVSFKEWLQARFPSAQIELLTVAWGGKTSVDFLAEPPGSEYHFEEKVLGAKPDLIISEFVNDASLEEKETEILKRHARLLASFREIGTEWIILTPHYVKPDWMGLARQRDIDEDPRLYVRVLREFSAINRIALADASRRYGRLWRQGIPFLTLMENGINHPNRDGHQIFAESLISLFAGSSSI